ncbi:hypothetical protein [Achromobacter ruhlandii]|uniref:hypothetical protein n=1 Tax=Achromobacter ruhlandii TaxID=72557 RepID=UPI0006BF053F|nr:hypothetical protein [Achromobacter ruhlandii]AVC43064.1 hypothetical protein AL520_24755 [Achromobacter xylosoxidans]CUJ38485.1 Uncharacterised protein [Achromobacter ruhlandii]CUJ66477.1 Uncharacterised protein [Achromobacter ruhlandii]CUK21254.1 Uncharacterised protein [Achromobacter ruhlandii]
MTTKPPDPLATRHDGTTDQDDQAPVDPHTQRLREENRALRELLAAQVQASIPRPPGPLKRLGWWLISAPGAALVGWRSLLGREHAAPITGKRVGYATLTVLYTLAIYGALVLLVVSCSTPNAGRSGASAAGPMRMPLAPLDAGPAPLRQPGATARPDAALPPADTPPPAPTPTVQEHASGPASTPQDASTPRDDTPVPGRTDAPSPAATTPSASAREAATPHATAPALPKPTLRITEIPAENPHAWVDSLKAELARCATLGFFERPDCAWAARKQYCGPNQGWGAVKECPAQP